MEALTLFPDSSTFLNYNKGMVEVLENLRTQILHRVQRDAMANIGSEHCVLDW